MLTPDADYLVKHG